MSFEYPEVQPWDIVEESGEETEDEHGNAVGAAAKNHRRAVGGVGGSKDDRAASTAVSSAAVDMPIASTTAAVGNDSDTAPEAIRPTALFLGSSAAVSGHIAAGSAAVGKGRGEVIDKGKGRADDEHINEEDYILLAINDFKAMKKVNDLEVEQKRNQTIVDKCEDEKIALNLLAKDIEQRSTAAKKLCVDIKRDIANAKLESTAASDKFLYVHKAVHGRFEAGASER